MMDIVSPSFERILIHNITIHSTQVFSNSLVVIAEDVSKEIARDNGREILLTAVVKKTAPTMLFEIL